MDNLVKALNDSDKMKMESNIFDINYEKLKILNEKLNIRIDYKTCIFLVDLFKQYHTRHKEMAIYGDSIYTKIIIEISFMQNYNKGEITKYRQKYTSNSFLSNKCDELFHISELLEMQYGEYSSNVKATFMESLFCFIYVNTGEENLKKFINENLF